MVLGTQQLAQYRNLGFVQIEDMFSEDEITEIGYHASIDLGEPTERRVFEKCGELVRAVHGSHLARPFFSELVRLPRLLDMAEQIVRDRVYIHQFKINAKAAHGGDTWAWHQDSFFWRTEDGMPDMQAVNFVIHLDEATDANGPLLLMPGSHHGGDLAAKAAAGAAWESTVSAKLKHEIDRTDLAAACRRYGIVAAKGGAGGVLIFHPSVIHGSTANMSPFDRRLLILSYNSASNQLLPVPDPRPEFLAARENTTPLTALDDDVLPVRSPNDRLQTVSPASW
ncbi:phytanoyl-CoA dioxygenase family protein [Pseudonocardia xinjiangensis]|uniref:phytanoyl-CoA dioxygenase family protein n=1 Tax=Pseudonocardia xinjiangensis TaxID=75289 RepID=UPI003D8FB8B8